MESRSEPAETVDDRETNIEKLVLEDARLVKQSCCPNRLSVAPVCSDISNPGPAQCYSEVLYERGTVMTTFVVRLVHTSDQCPTANSKIRDRVAGGAAEIPALAERLGVKIVTGPLVLASEHESVAVVEANGVEAVNDFIQQSGLIQWNSVRVSMAEPLEDALGRMDLLPPPIY
jgi:hypothetical protein